jgi:hypothetical protein
MQNVRQSGQFPLFQTLAEDSSVGGSTLEMH